MSIMVIILVVSLLSVFIGWLLRDILYERQTELQHDHIYSLLFQNESYISYLKQQHQARIKLLHEALIEDKLAYIDKHSLIVVKIEEQLVLINELIDDSKHKTKNLGSLLHSKHDFRDCF